MWRADEHTVTTVTIWCRIHPHIVTLAHHTRRSQTWFKHNDIGNVFIVSNFTYVILYTCEHSLCHLFFYKTKDYREIVFVRVLMIRYVFFLFGEVLKNLASLKAKNNLDSAKTANIGSTVLANIISTVSLRVYIFNWLLLIFER